MTSPALSYAQRFEDLHLLRALGDRPDGFYVDIGAGHPVVDNVSFAFYLKGWRGIAVEPNPALARLNAAVRPRDRVVQALAGGKAGTATFYLVDEFHGLSTMIEPHARRAVEQFGKTSRPIELPVVPLSELCAAHAPERIDFLKVDVEGAETEVLRGADFGRHRPKVVLVEALAPYSLDPAWETFEPLLTSAGYRFVFFDTLNRYYVAEEEGDVAARLADNPASVEGTTQIGLFGGALADPTHPDHRTATVLARAALTVLPLLNRETVCDLLTAGLTGEQLDRPAERADVVRAAQRLCDPEAAENVVAAIGLVRGETVRNLYGRLADSDWFRTTAGRISGSYSW